jgi:hypothetical protein
LEVGLIGAGVKLSSAELDKIDEIMRAAAGTIRRMFTLKAE